MIINNLKFLKIDVKGNNDFIQKKWIIK